MIAVSPQQLDPEPVDANEEDPLLLANDWPHVVESEEVVQGSEVIEADNSSHSSNSDIGVQYHVEDVQMVCLIPLDYKIELQYHYRFVNNKMLPSVRV